MNVIFATFSLKTTTFSVQNSGRQVLYTIRVDTMSKEVFKSLVDLTSTNQYFDVPNAVKCNNAQLIRARHGRELQPTSDITLVKDVVLEIQVG